MRQETDRERALQARAENLERERHDLILREIADVRERDAADNAMRSRLRLQSRHASLR